LESEADGGVGGWEGPGGGGGYSVSDPQISQIGFSRQDAKSQSLTFLARISRLAQIFFLFVVAERIQAPQFLLHTILLIEFKEGTPVDSIDLKEGIILRLEGKGDPHPVYFSHRGTKIAEKISYRMGCDSVTLGAL
jgi:hypothetical protein